MPYTSRLNKFCSKSCSAQFNNKLRPPMSNTQKEKISSTNISNNKIKCSCLKCKQEFTFKNFKTHFNKCIHKNESFCHVCNNPTGKNRKTCSSECLHILRSENAKNNTNLNGNHNRHSGWVKLKGDKRFYAESKWEEKLVLLLDSYNIRFFRPKPLKYTINNITKNYFPDVYLPDYDVFLEPKNPYLLSQQIEKLEIVQKTHDITLFVIDDILKINENLIHYITTSTHKKHLEYI